MTGDGITHNRASGIANRQRPPRTTCKICWCSVFPEDVTVWVVSPQPGLAHKTCAEAKTTTKD